MGADGNTLFFAKAFGRKLAPGVYAWRGEVHYDVEELLADYGLPATPENVEGLARELQNACRAEGTPTNVIRTTDEPTN